MFKRQMILAASLQVALSAFAVAQKSKQLPSTADPLGTAITAKDKPNAAPAATVTVHPLIGGDKANGGAVQMLFDVNAPAGTRVSLSYVHGNVRGATSSHARWQVAGDEPALIKLSLGYRPNFAGDRSISVLESDAENLELRTDATGCTVRGSVTSVSAPLVSVPRDDRVIAFHPGENLPLVAKQPLSVLVVTQKGKEQIDKAFDPYSMLTIGLYVPQEKQPIPSGRRLPGRWLLQSQAVGTAHIKYRYLMLGDNFVKPLARNAMNVILVESELEEHPERFADAVRMLIDRPEIADKPWAEGEFRSVGVKTRDDNSFQTRLFDGDLDFDHNFANNQVTAYRGTSSPVFRKRLSAFRLAGQPGASLDDFEVQDLPSGRVMLRKEENNSSREMLVDAATGFIRHQLAINGRSRNGESVSEDFQYAPQAFPAEIIFPRLIVRAAYTNDKLERLEMTMLDEVEINETFPRDTFKLAAKANTKLFTRNADLDDRSRFIKTIPEDVADVAVLVRAHDEQRAAKEPK